MRPIAEWLEKLGLEQYAQRFAENGVDFSVLRHLTDQDLKDIGVLHCRACRRCSGHAQPTGAIEPKPHDAAERRQLTVMFCDLVGSTELSSRLDPEDMREVIPAYRTACSGVMPTYDGFVAEFMGDSYTSATTRIMGLLLRV